MWKAAMRARGAAGVGPHVHGLPWWSFSRQDYCWSKDGSLYFAESPTGGSGIDRLPAGGRHGGSCGGSKRGGAFGTSRQARMDRASLGSATPGSDPAGNGGPGLWRRAASLFSAKQGWLMLLASREGLLVAHQERLDGPVRVLSLSPGALARDPAVPWGAFELAPWWRT